MYNFSTGDPIDDETDATTVSFIKNQRSPYRSNSSASEMVLIFTTQLYSCLCNYNAIFSYVWTGGEYCNRNTPNPNTPLSSLLFSSKPLAGSGLSRSFCTAPPLRIDSSD